MTAADAASYLGLSVRTLENKRTLGTGPVFVKVGRIFYYRADLDDWLRSRRATSTAAARQRAAAERGGEG